MMHALLALVYSVSAMATVTSGLTADLRRQAERSAATLRVNFEAKPLSEPDALFDSKVEPLQLAFGAGVAAALAGGATFAGRRSSLNTMQLLREVKLAELSGEELSRLLPKVGKIVVSASGAYYLGDSAVNVSSSVAKVAAGKILSPKELLKQGAAGKLVEGPVEMLGELFNLSPAERSAARNEMEKAVKETVKEKVKGKDGEPAELSLGEIFANTKVNGRDLFGTAERKRILELFTLYGSAKETDLPNISYADDGAFLIVATAKLQYGLETEGKDWTPDRRRRVQQVIEQNLAALRHLNILGQHETIPAQENPEMSPPASDAR